MDGIAHEQTIICRQLFAGHAAGSRPMERKKNLLRMIRCVTGNVEVANSRRVANLFLFVVGGGSLSWRAWPLSLE